MEQSSKKFLYDILTTPSPTGFETKVQKIVKKRMEKYADLIETDLHGNLIVAINPDAERKIMLAGHCDQLGFMVKYITKEGYLYIEPLGGHDPVILPGTHVVVYTEKGEIPGVIGRKPIHLQKPEERSKGNITFDDLWVDLGFKDQAEAEKVVTIGDPMTVKLGVTELQNNLISSPGLDDKSGVFVVMEALRLCATAKIKNIGVYAVSTVQEEVGLRGAKTAAFGIDPEVGIAVDVTFATDNPGKKDDKQAPCVLGNGPTFGRGPTSNPIVDKMLIDAAKKAKSPYQLTPSSRIIGNDSAAIQVNRQGVAAGSLNIPNRYMHTQVEVCSLDDMENGAKVLFNFIKSITAKTDFRPF